jgi:hypothetical protein
VHTDLIVEGDYYMEYMAAFSMLEGGREGQSEH